MYRILHTIDTTGPGGAETVFIDLATRLDRSRFEPVVAIRGPGWVEDELRRRGIVPHVLGTSGSFDIGYLKALLRLVRRHRIDLIQSHLLGSNVYCGLAGLLSRIPVVATFHGAADVGDTERLLRLKVAIMNRGVDRIVFVSQALQQQLVSRLHFRRKRAVRIYNGIDVERFAPEPDRLLRRELGIDDADILVGAIGNIRPSKAYDVLLRAAALLRQRSPRYRFVVAGQGNNELYRWLVKLRGDLGLEGVFHFLGFRADVAAVLNALDVFVLSSTSEGFSISTVEAMACGVPVVVTRSGGPEEIVSDGDNGLLVDTASESQLAAAIARVGDDVDLRSRLVSMGSSLVRSRFTLEAMVGAYTHVYDELLLGRRPRA